MGEAELLQLASGGFRDFAAALLYGTDEEAVLDMAGRIQRAWASGEVTVAEAAGLKSQHGVLLDLIGSQSLFGGRALVVVEGVDDRHAALLAPFLADAGRNALLLVAGSLRKNSVLRTAAERSRACAVAAFHKEDQAAQLIRIRRSGATRGLSFRHGAAERLLELCGGDRALVTGEIEKLCLLRPADGAVSSELVDEACAEKGAADVNAVIDALLDGNVAGFDRSIGAVMTSAELSTLLPLLLAHLARLAQVKEAVDGGVGWEAAFQKAKPPFYFGQQAKVRDQLARFSLGALLRLQQGLQDLTLQSRMSGPIGDLAAARSLFSWAVRLKTRNAADIR